MTTLTIVLVALLAAWILAYARVGLWIWTAVIGLALAILTLASESTTFVLQLAWVGWCVLALNNMPMLRRRFVSAPMMSLYRRLLPTISATEREALEAGSVWWDAELFSGRPNWKRLLNIPARRLTAEERAFLEGPAEELCKMLDDWQITHEWCDLPPEVWKFIKDEGFLGIIIPKRYGGLEFSAEAHSAVIGKVASRSGSAAVNAMVPNSLGPAELLMRYGTEAQKDYYLPNLASGKELPCFALTNPFAGSDAASIPDHGIVCHGEYKGERVLGMQVTWEKRYITLAPVATVLGLAYQLYDPEHLLGEAEHIGITLALIPTNHPGVEIGRRHYPANQAFQNGPTSGKDVFIPMDMVIGGQERVGQGWRMLMNCLAAGRGISLPALGASGAKFCARTAGAYARVRKQFKLPVGQFEGVEEALARIAGAAYAVEAARHVTCLALDHGHEPSVLSALLKYQATERQRKAINDAMDVHGGRAICEGPSNYMFNAYQGIPIGITVEGANILTRSLIVFGQGAIRCHPWLLKEMEAAQDPDEGKGLAAFDEALCGHIGFIISNFARALFLNLTAARWVSTPAAGTTSHWYGQLERASASFALVADAALLLLGGALKRREKLSGRFADILGEMYLISCSLKRFLDDGRNVEDLPLVDWVCHTGFYSIEQSLDGILQNFPSRPLAWLLRRIVFPLGMRRKPASDELGHLIASILLEPSATRERLTTGIFVSKDPADITGRLEHALELMPKVEAVEGKLLAAEGEGRLKAHSAPERIAEALRAGVIDSQEAEFLTSAESAIRAVIDVDDFDPVELTASARGWQADVA